MYQKRFINFLLQDCLLCDNLPCGQLMATSQLGMFIKIVNALWWVVLKFTMLTGISEATKHFGLSSACWLFAHVQVDQVCKILSECWHWRNKVLGELAMRGSYLSCLKLFIAIFYVSLNVCGILFFFPLSLLIFCNVAKGLSFEFIFLVLAFETYFSHERTNRCLHIICICGSYISTVVEIIFAVWPCHKRKRMD